MAMVKMRSAKDREVTGVSFDGKTYEPDAKGVFDVPEGAVPVLLGHGLEVVPDPKGPPAAKPPAAKP